MFDALHARYPLCASLLHPGPLLKPNSAVLKRPMTWQNHSRVLLIRRQDYLLHLYYRMFGHDPILKDFSCEPHLQFYQLAKRERG